MRKFLDSISFVQLIIMSLLLGLAPFVPEPHLFEKVRLLLSGELSKTIDIFDLLMHSAPLILLTLKLTLGTKNQSND